MNEFTPTPIRSDRAVRGVSAVADPHPKSQTAPLADAQARPYAGVAPLANTSPLANTAPLAELRGVTKRYGATVALDDVDLEARPGEVLALLGPNGAGKTTAVHLMLGLLRPTSGEARLFGHDPRAASAKMRVGTMLQISGVPATLTVREHLRSFAAYYPAPLPIDHVLDVAGLSDVARRPYGKLSGGQKQRVHFALALVGDPDLLFLDEPTTGLDVASRRAFWEQVRSFLHGGRTVVLTTHYLEEADALADRVVVLDHGRVLAEGTPAAIKSRAAGRRVRAITRLAAAELELLPGVVHVRRAGTFTELLTTEAETTMRELLQRDPALTDLEVTGASLEEAFLALTEDYAGTQAGTETTADTTAETTTEPTADAFRDRDHQPRHDRRHLEGEGR